MQKQKNCSVLATAALKHFCCVCVRVVEEPMAFRAFFACLCSLGACVSGSSVAHKLVELDGVSAWSLAHGAAVPFAKSCGISCTSLLQTALAKLNRTAEGNGGAAAAGSDLLNLLAGNVEQSLARADDLAKGSAGSSSGKISLRNMGLRGQSRVFASDNVPCATTAACAVKAMAANKCNYARVALQSTYNELNVATHVLGVLVSSLCGCVHAGHVSNCALRSLPAVCVFPYTVYSKAFAGSVQVWEAVKAATKKCIIHRGPATSP